MIIFFNYFFIQISGKKSFNSIFWINETKSNEPPNNKNKHSTKERILILMVLDT